MPSNASGWFWHSLGRETGRLGHLFSPGGQRGPWPWLSAPYLSDVELGRRGMTDGNLEALMGIVGPPTMQDRFEAIIRATKAPLTDNGARIKSP